jgi:hypothetical protein
VAQSDQAVSPIGISWASRSVPLRPAAVLGQGSVASILARALVDGLARGVDLDVHASDGFLLAIGDEHDLPWVDGATWLGRDGPLLIPTSLEPSLDTGLLARAIARRIGAVHGWVILLPDQLLTGERSVGVTDVGRLHEIAAKVPG